MLPHWTAKKIGIRIKNKSFKNKRSKEEGNPIKVRLFFWFMNEVVIVLLFSSGKKYYLANKVAPPIHHNSIQPFDCYSTTALCDVPPNLLPERWREMMLIHGGMRCRSRKNDLFALRPVVPHYQPTHYILYGIPSLPQPTMSTPTVNIMRTKSMGHPPTKTKKKKSDSNNSKTDEQIAQASQRIPQSVYSPVLCDLVETDNNNSCTNIDLNNLQPTEVIIILSEFVLDEYFQPLTVHIILAF
jgi:hypothetical protein